MSSELSLNDDDDFIVDFSSSKKTCQTLVKISSTQENVCSICQKDISTFTQTRKLQHLNKCLDVKEQKQKFAEEKQRYDSTIDCPLCGGQLPPGPFRTTHLKKCSQQNKIAVASVLQLVKTQEQIAAAKRAKNLPHTTAAKPTIETCGVKKTKNKLLPKSIGDEQLQLALSLSASECLNQSEACCSSTNISSSNNIIPKELKIATFILETVKKEEQLEKLQGRLLNVIGNIVAGEEPNVETNGKIGLWKLHMSKEMKFHREVEPEEVIDAEVAHKIMSPDASISSNVVRVNDQEKADEVNDLVEMKSPISFQEKMFDDYYGEECGAVTACSSPLHSLANNDDDCAVTKDVIFNEDCALNCSSSSGDMFERAGSAICLDDAEYFREIDQKLQDMPTKSDQSSQTVEEVESDELANVDSSHRDVDDDVAFVRDDLTIDDAATFTGDVFHCEIVQATIVSSDEEIKRISENAASSSMKTATPKLHDYRNKTFIRETFTIVKRTDVTPMPEFERLESPDLKAHLSKYGVKPMARRRAVPMLKRLYDETHPFIGADGSVVVEKRENEAKLSRRKKRRISCSQPVQKREMTNQTKKLTAVKEKTKKTKSCVSLSQQQEQNESSSSSNDEEQCDPLAEESFRPDDCLDNDELNVDEQLNTFFTGNATLYRQILKYEPMPLKETHCRVKKAGIKCSLKRFIDYLDSQCITFTMKDERKNPCARFRSPKRKARTTK